MRKNKERTRFIRKRVLFFCWYEGYRGETAGAAGMEGIGATGGCGTGLHRVASSGEDEDSCLRRRLTCGVAEVRCRGAASGIVRPVQTSFTREETGDGQEGTCGLMSGSQKKNVGR